MPTFDVETRHEVRVAAAPEQVYAVARELDLSSSRSIRLLFALRGIPQEALTAAGLERLRFKPLLEDPPRQFGFGIIGKFWTLRGDLVDFDPAEFLAFEAPGYARAIWSFEVEDTGAGSSLLRTSTRVRCLDPISRRRFRRYWHVVGPLSGLVRRRALAVIKSTCEE